MMHMTFRNIGDAESLFMLIDDCTGPIYLQSETDIKMDIKKNAAVKKLLVEACNKNGIEKLNVIISNQDDIPRVLDYLLARKYRFRKRAS